ncbi:MAG: rhomboid family intramembrane serine protease [Verrucomicrobiota bacterium]
MPSRPWPPNPRDAKHGNFATLTHYLPVTLFLIVISAVIAALTLAGKNTAPADALYMSSQQGYQTLERLGREYNDMLEKQGYVLTNGHFELADGKTDFAPAQIREIEALASELKLTAARVQDPLADIRRGQVWRLVTPIFLHFGILHIVFNLMWLWQFGVMLEMRFRSLGFLGLVVVVAVLSNLAQGLWHGANFGGMSGVNYGLFGFVLLRSKLHPSPDLVLHPSTVSMMLIWLVVCFTGALGPVANTAHLVGLGVGGAIGAATAMRSGGWQIIKRRQSFRSALAASATCLHQCSTCGKTERSDPDREFYVSQEDHQEYCSEHLPENRKGV